MNWKHEEQKKLQEAFERTAPNGGWEAVANRAVELVAARGGTMTVCQIDDAITNIDFYGGVRGDGADIQHDAQNLRCHIAAQGARIAALEADLEIAKRKRPASFEMEKELEKALAECDGLKSRIDVLREKASTCEAEMVRARSECETLKAALTNMTDLRDGYRKAGALEHERAEKAEAEIERLTKRCESLEAALSERTKTMQEARAAADDFTNAAATATKAAADWAKLFRAAERRAERAERTLFRAGFEDKGGEEWCPPLGPNASPLLAEIDRWRAKAVEYDVERNEANARRQAAEAHIESIRRRASEVGNIERFISEHGLSATMRWVTEGTTAPERFPCSPTCTHDDAAKPRHFERANGLSEELGHPEMNPREVTAYEAGHAAGIEAMRAACWEAVRQELQRLGYHPPDQICDRIKSAIEGATP